MFAGAKAIFMLHAVQRWHSVHFDPHISHSRSYWIGSREYSNWNWKCQLLFESWVFQFTRNLTIKINTIWIFFAERFLSQFLFFFLPVGIIILLNVVLFVMIAISFQEARKRATTNDENNFNIPIPSTQHIDKWEISTWIKISCLKIKIAMCCALPFSVQVYLGLFVIAGVAWILEIVSFLLTPGNAIYLITDIWNCAQGLLIFTLLVMRRSIFQLIKERFVDAQIQAVCQFIWMFMQK